MDIKIVDTEVKTPDKIETQEPEQLSSPVAEGLQQAAIQQVMDIEDSEKHKYTRDLEILLDYAKSQTKDHSPQNLKWVIRSLELKLGTPPLAERRIKYVSRYAYLVLETSKIKEEMQQFVQNP